MDKRADILALCPLPIPSPPWLNWFGLLAGLAKPVLSADRDGLEGLGGKRGLDGGSCADEVLDSDVVWSLDELEANDEGTAPSLEGVAPDEVEGNPLTIRLPGKLKRWFMGVVSPAEESSVT